MTDALKTGLIAATISGLVIGSAIVHASDTEPGIDTRHPHWQHDYAYITDIGTLLYRDTDNDGYFAGMSLTIDADTPNHDERVYASIDLISPDQSIERLHTTGDFTIYGTSLSDEYRVDIDLVRNYPTAIYDLRLSLHDARDDRVLDQVGASHFSNLRQLPLESEDLDFTFANPANDPPPTHTTQNPNNDIRVSEYGGSAGTAFLALLIAALCIRRVRRPLG